MPANTFFSDTGNSATIVFTTTGFTARYHQLGASKDTIAKIETSHLGTTVQKTHIPGDLYDPNETQCEFEWPLGTPMPIAGASETVTITLPLPTAKTTAATVAGTGFVKERSSPVLKNDMLMMGSYTLVWDGLTNKTYTPAA
jgi:hypothetical protein